MYKQKQSYVINSMHLICPRLEVLQGKYYEQLADNRCVRIRITST